MWGLGQGNTARWSWGLPQAHLTGRTPILCSQAALCGSPVTSTSGKKSTILHLAGPGFFFFHHKSHRDSFI